MMSRAARKVFYCGVVSETVSISLARRRRFSGRGDLFVQCSESDCQHVDANVPPCPLHLGMFAEEIESRIANRRTDS